MFWCCEPCSVCYLILMVKDFIYKSKNVKKHLTLKIFGHILDNCSYNFYLNFFYCVQKLSIMSVPYFSKINKKELQKIDICCKV